MELFFKGTLIEFLLFFIVIIAYDKAKTGIKLVN